ncbi:sulfotransferase [Tropicimonas sp. TH_r6]|uniref:sulfotransferase family protein n=1 Tax=Tropicimonas sp. TH_r6 TaxID=3082085 RepID=UPI0029535369|nr:sulfotransferase [Tropicimonas sp. TH_r6]MDV7142070.1 sulfotransferase [Tropicimonas sp. TH_r6]
MTRLAGQRVLIVAGEPKAGTTSLFDWLAHHPDICASTLKETRFFLDADYPLSRPEGFSGDNLDAYAALFADAGKPVWLEATPDYMYCETFRQVATLLPEARVVVLLRDPVDRLISAYRFFRQRGLLANGLSFDDWIAQQGDLGVAPDTPVAFRTLDQCDLGKYLPPLRAAFGPRLLEIGFAELKSEPQSVLDRVCAHCGLAPLPLDPARFAASNQTTRARHPGTTRGFNRLHRLLSQKTLAAPKLRAALRPVARGIRGALTSSAPPETIHPSAHSLEIIRRHAGAGAPARI